MKLLLIPRLSLLMALLSSPPRLRRTATNWLVYRWTGRRNYPKSVRRVVWHLSLFCAGAFVVAFWLLASFLYVNYLSR